MDLLKNGQFREPYLSYVIRLSSDSFDFRVLQQMSVDKEKNFFFFCVMRKWKENDREERTYFQYCVTSRLKWNAPELHMAQPLDYLSQFPWIVTEANTRYTVNHAVSAMLPISVAYLLHIEVSYTGRALLALRKHRCRIA